MTLLRYFIHYSFILVILIESFYAIYLSLGRNGSRPSRVVQTSISSATFSGGILRLDEINNRPCTIWFYPKASYQLDMSGGPPAGDVQEAYPDAQTTTTGSFQHEKAAPASLLISTTDTSSIYLSIH